MNPTESAVESLMKQMRLTEPSANLDQTIYDLVGKEVVDLPCHDSKTVRHGRFGWAALVATAVAATVCGLLLGQFVSIYPSTRSAIADVPDSVDSVPVFSDSDRSRQIMPVKFSIGAFEMMHGHSRQEEFANCTTCHVPSAQSDEVFEGWYYGDEGFFETHDFKGVANCSACHVFSNSNQPETGQNDLNGSELPGLHGGSPEFLDGECSNCHAGSPG